ncbi:Transducin (beta)-like 1 X-linked receptor 1 [Irineochytrium annulatum]|nr:Transducin (beta)-like 1 X-linked receptor 1 [Irineochytrium annulatum]
MSITSDEVNYLVYRYLLESGFQHSTFAFQQESNIHTRDYHHQYNYSLGGHLQGIPHQQRPDEIRASRVPPGALIHYLQKGLQYVEVEAHSLEASNLLDWTAKKCGAPFSLVLPHECEPLTEDGLMTEKGGGSGSMTMKSTNNTTNNTAAGAKRDRREGRKGQNSEREKRARKESVVFETPLVTNLNGTEKDANTNGRSVEVEASTSGVKPILSSEITFLVGHKAEVFACAWNPKFMLIATGAGDGTARIWKVPVDPCEPITDAIILDHNIEGEMKDVTTVDWNPGGLSLATGAYDGHARIWSKAGK